MKSRKVLSFLIRVPIFVVWPFVVPFVVLAWAIYLATRASWEILEGLLTYETPPEEQD